MPLGAHIVTPHTHKMMGPPPKELVAMDCIVRVNNKALEPFDSLRCLSLMIWMKESLRLHPFFRQLCSPRTRGIPQHSLLLYGQQQGGKRRTPALFAILASLVGWSWPPLPWHFFPGRIQVLVRFPAPVKCHKSWGRAVLRCMDHFSLQCY
jgi:hypothetical protein